MNIKSLLLGSAAALAAVSGAQAADAIVAAEPEPMEYVRVCDAFGTGYFYIPGTETCLKIGGYVRFEMQLGQTASGAGVYPVDFALGDDDYWDATGRAQLDITAKSDTELGTLTSVASLRWDYGNNNVWTNNDNAVYINEAYIQLGGFKVGRFYNPWDKGLNGEQDAIASGNTTRMNSIGYFYTGDTFSAGVQVDELSRAAGQEVGVEAIVSAKFGAVAFDLLGAYDFGAEEGAIRALASAAVGPGTLQAAVVWSSGLGVPRAASSTLYNAYYDEGEWALAASYAFKVNDKLTLTPGATYVWNTETDADGDWTGDDAWRAGLTVDYKIVEGFSAKTSVDYNENAVTEYWRGFVRLDRTF
ncbi:porin-like protein [Neorhizobium sp. R1-B]|uniref:porin n=1 Tax=unclassified Neorhizobium TaxID=2629175 RepID=UPI00104837B8|nr:MULTISPECIES: porin [unclassified Neorhizobium]TCV72854.1 porin-like protein [Neorhizobium sp. S3-V5DH]TDX88044.1 porin-like protein [Neorhizobium sp. R1-B]